MQEFHAHMDKHGRLLIPSQLRNELNYKPGNSFVMKAANDELHIISLDKVVKSAQKLFKKYHNSGASAVDEFLRQKHLEAEKENLKFSSK